MQASSMFLRLFVLSVIVVPAVLWAQQPAAPDPFAPPTADPFAAPAADPFGPNPAAPDPFAPAPRAVPAADPFGPAPARAAAPVAVAATDYKRLAWWSATGTSSQMLFACKAFAPKPCELKLVDLDLSSAKLKELTPPERLSFMLNQPIRLRLVQVTLGDLVEELREKLALNVFVDKHSLDESAFDTATPLYWSVERPIKLRDALRLLLRDLALTHYRDEGTLVITTRTAAENRLVVRTYNIDPDLLKVRKRLRRPQQFWGQFGGYGSGSGLFNLRQGGLGGGLGFGGASPTLHAEYDEVESLVSTITSIIQPTTWKQNGGLGDIMPNLQVGLLVVSNTEEVQDEVAALLDVFKEKLAERKPPPVSPDAVERIVHPVVLPAVRLKQQNPLDHHRPISKEPAFTMEQLVEQIKKQVAPTSWDKPEHTISTLGQNLIVNQTRANQEKIAAFLKQLGITKEQVDDEKQFADEQEQARKDLDLRQAQERERLEKEQEKREADERKREEEKKRQEQSK